MIHFIKAGYFASSFVFTAALASIYITGSAYSQGTEEFEETVRLEDFELKLPVGLPADKYEPRSDNPITLKKVELGRLLFFDKRLSADDTVSCATCHSPDDAFTDNRKVSVGINGQQGTRSAPTIINRVFSTEQFWDGRAVSLEDQAKAPLINPVEMGNSDHRAVVEKVRSIKGYRTLFSGVFGKEINIDDIARAIAAFERTVVSGNSALDRFYFGDPDALSEQQKRGLELFRGKARCTQCHAGFNLTDEKYHNIGVGWNGSFADKGRYEVTKKPANTGAFKTPTLRDITETAPYMHDGSIKTLEEVIEFYDKGGVFNPFLANEMKRSGLSLLEMLEAFEKKDKSKTASPQKASRLNLKDTEKEDLIEFMKALSGTGWRHISRPQSFPE